MSEFKKLSDEELSKVTGGVNWPAYGDCLISEGASDDPELADLVFAIVTKDWVKVAILSAQIKIINNPKVNKCFSEYINV